MLDQNTDRMWYVIGAVLIGGLIVAGMVNLSTTTMNAVSDSMGSYVDNADFDEPNIYNKNKVINSGIYGYTVTGDLNGGNLRTTIHSNTRAFIWKVKPNERYIITRSDKRNSRFGLGFSDKDPTPSNSPLKHVTAEFQNALEMDFVVPKDMNYAYLYLYDTNAQSDDLPEIVIKKVKDSI